MEMDKNVGEKPNAIDHLLGKSLGTVFFLKIHRSRFMVIKLGI